MLSLSKAFDVKIELRHKQLRDLVKISDGIVYPEARRLVKLDHEGTRSLVAPLPDSPHCIEVGSEIILCGGVSRGNGQVISVGKSVESYDVGCELINAVGFINSTTGFACCNDNGLYIGDLTAGWKTVNTINAFMPVNSAAYSDKLLALSGDRKGVQIYAVDGTSLTRTQTLSTPLGAEVGISVAFAPGGQLLATAFQSGETSLWDVRNLNNPLTTLRSVSRISRQSPGSFRVAEFAGPLDDLLFVSEEHGVVHMLDTRTLESYVVMLDGELTTKKRKELVLVTQTLPDTLGLAYADDQLVIGTTDGIVVADVQKRNMFPVMDWR